MMIINPEISNLTAVEEELNQFDVTKWTELGLELDISYDKLRVIQSDNQTDISQCL